MILPLRISRPDGSDNRLSDILVTDGPRGVAMWIEDHSGHTINGDYGKVRIIYGKIEEWCLMQGTEKDFPHDQMYDLVREYFGQN